MILDKRYLHFIHFNKVNISFKYSVYIVLILKYKFYITLHKKKWKEYWLYIYTFYQRNIKTCDFVAIFQHTNSNLYFKYINIIYDLYEFICINDISVIFTKYWQFISIFNNYIFHYSWIYINSYLINMTDFLYNCV